MAQAYQLVGSQDPASRINRWVVESPSEDYPDGKVLEVGGNPVELSAEQYSIGSRFFKLQPVKASEEPNVQYVDQPGVEMTSLSTDNPPDPGTLPDIDDMSADDLRAEARRVGADVPGNASKDEVRKAIRRSREEA